MQENKLILYNINKTKLHSINLQFFREGAATFPYKRPRFVALIQAGPSSGPVAGPSSAVTHAGPAAKRARVDTTSETGNTVPYLKFMFYTQILLISTQQPSRYTEIYMFRF